MSETWHPTFRYHPALAPTGKKFTDRAVFDALNEEWVDTPAKFPVVEERPVDSALPPKRKKKESA